MTRNLLALALVAAAHVWPSAGFGQSPERVPIVGVLTVTAGPSDPVATKFRDGLAQLGYVDGQNIKIDHRNAEGHADQLPRLAEELIRVPVDVIAVGAEPALSAVTQATKTIPIVVVSVDEDLVATGLVKSLSHPGGNITGLSALQSELAAKRLELLRDAIPKLTRVGVFWDPLNRRGASDIEAAARSLGLAVQPIEVRSTIRLRCRLSGGEEEQGWCSPCTFFSGVLYPTCTACEGCTKRACTDYVP